MRADDVGAPHAHAAAAHCTANEAGRGGGGGGGRAIAITLCRRPRILPPSLPSIERPPLVSCQFARASHGLNEDQLTAILAYGAETSEGSLDRLCCDKIGRGDQIGVDTGE